MNRQILDSKWELSLCQEDYNWRFLPLHNAKIVIGWNLPEKAVSNSMQCIQHDRLLKALELIFFFFWLDSFKTPFEALNKDVISEEMEMIERCKNTFTY